MKNTLILLMLYPAVAFGDYTLDLEGNHNVEIHSERRVVKTGEGDDWNGFFWSRDLLPNEFSVSSWLAGSQDQPREGCIFGLTEVQEGGYIAIAYGILYDHDSFQIFTDGGAWKSADIPVARGSVFAINYKLRVIGGQRKGSLEFYLNHERISFDYNGMSVNRFVTEPDLKFYLDGALPYEGDEVLIYAKEL